MRVSDYFCFFVKFINLEDLFVFMLNYFKQKSKTRIVLCNICVEFSESEKFVNDILQFLVVIELELELELNFYGILISIS